MTHTEARNALRDTMRSRREALPARARLAAAEAVATHLRAFEPIRGARYVAGYWAMRGELPLHALLAPPPAFAYCLPCLAPERELRFAAWRAGDALRTNRYGIPEPDLAQDATLAPEALDVVLMPVVAFDRAGTRLGSGAGYYDRSFAFLQTMTRPTRPLLVGVAYAFQEADALRAESWDVALDFVATEAGLGHLVATRGIPLVTLAGPTDPVVWRPVTPLWWLVRAQDFGSDRMEAIPVEAVTRALADALRWEAGFGLA